MLLVLIIYVYFIYIILYIFNIKVNSMFYFSTAIMLFN